MKRLLLYSACVGSVVVVVVAVVMAIGIELVQVEKRRDWREAMAP